MYLSLKITILAIRTFEITILAIKTCILQFHFCKLTMLYFLYIQLLFYVLNQSNYYFWYKNMQITIVVICIFLYQNCMYLSLKITFFAIRAFKITILAIRTCILQFVCVTMNICQRRLKYYYCT